jgi:uncharacterized protein YkwD
MVLKQFALSRRSYIYALLIAGLSFIIIVIFSTVQLASGQPVYKSGSSVMESMVDSTNDLRLGLGLPGLEPRQSLEQSAYLKAEAMKNDYYWGHYAPDGTRFSKYIWQKEPSAVLVGENLARCFDNYDMAFKALVNSPTHYAVLTGDFDYIGVSSITLDDGCESIVMHFVKI